MGRARRTAFHPTALGAFGIISILSNGEREPATIESYRGLFWRRPALAVIFTAMLLSLAGIPITAGFIAKFYVLAAGVSSARWVLVITLVVRSAIGLYYYLRVVVALYETVDKDVAAGRLALTPKLLLGAPSVLLDWFGVFPGGLLRVIPNAVASLT